MQTLVKHVRLYEPEKKTFFAVSDLHGDYKGFMTIEEKGFDINNPDHILIVAGDIIEGHSNDENKILQYMMKLDKQGRLLAVIGNHDYKYINCRFDKGDGLLVPYADGDKMVIGKEEWDFLKSLPIAIRTPHFNVVHGIWCDRAIARMNGDDIKLMLNGSPAVVGTIEFYKRYGNNLKYIPKFQTKDNYIKSLPKPTIVGHFYKYHFAHMIDDFENEYGHRNPLKNKHYKIMNNGAYRKGNLIAIDNCIHKTKNSDAFVFGVRGNKIYEKNERV